MTARHFATGFGFGVLATVLMTVVMVAGMVSGLSPIPKPIPVALTARVLGPGTAPAVLMVVGLVAHLIFGGFWAGVLWLVARPVSVVKVAALSVALWLFMQTVVLPILGWGVFGVRVTPGVWAATLLLHLVYGATLAVPAWREMRTDTQHKSGIAQQVLRAR